jgi:hypothetical protein
MENLNKEETIISNNSSESEELTNLIESIELDEETNEETDEESDEESTSTSNEPLDILEYFDYCRSIRDTASKYNMEIEELMDNIVGWDGCSDGLYRAHDYDECCLEVKGRSYEDENHMYNLGRRQWDFDMMMRNLKETDEVDEFVNDYKSEKYSLYDLADKFDITIYNLFKNLKVIGLINKENEALRFSEFYTEHCGVKSKWDGIENIDLIEVYDDNYNHYIKYTKKIEN